MMTWGFPCTDISCAGKQKGFLDENGEKTRSGMYYEGIRILRYKKPAISIIENVKNLTSKRFKKEFEMVLSDLDEAGYNSYYKVLNAKNYGVPQNRERVFIISIRKDLDNGQFKFPEPFDNGIRLKDILENEVDEKFYLSDDKEQKVLSSLNQSELPVTTRNSDTVSTIRATYYKNGERNVCENIENGNGYEGVVESNSVKQIGNMSNGKSSWSNPQTGRIYSAEGISPTLNTCGGGQREPKIVTGLVSSKGKKFDKEIDIANTLLARDYKGFGNQAMNAVIKIPKDTKADGCYINQSPSFTRAPLEGLSRTLKADSHAGVYDGIRIRKLTPRETWRLMGFSDWDFDAAKNVGISNSQLYKQAGNSIVVDVLYYIYVELYKAMPYLFDDLKLSSFFSGIGAFESALDRLYDGINSGNFTHPQAKNSACGECQYDELLPAALRYQRNEYAKRIRKDYESGKINERRCNLREYTLRRDGCSNTISTVVKDNYVVVSAAIRGRYVNDKSKAVQLLEVGSDAYSNSITTVQKDSVVVEIT